MGGPGRVGLVTVVMVVMVRGLGAPLGGPGGVELVTVVMVVMVWGLGAP